MAGQRKSVFSKGSAYAACRPSPNDNRPTGVSEAQRGQSNRGTRNNNKDVNPNQSK